MRLKKKLTLLVFSLLSLSVMGQEVRKEYDTENYWTRLSDFAKHPLRKGQIVFLGNSLTQHGKWESYFNNKDVANRGIAGDNTEGMLARVAEIAESKPRVLFIMAGINDISQNVSNDIIIARIRSIIRQIDIKSPETKIYLQSVLPFNNDFGRYKRLVNKERQAVELNKELAQYCKLRGDITFINIYPHLLDKKDKLNAKYTNDGLHLNADGYAIWVEQIRQYVE